jgi:hypothetical protein
MLYYCGIDTNHADRSDQRISYLGEYCGIDTIKSSGLHSLNDKSNLDPDQFFPGFFHSLKNEGRRTLSYLSRNIYGATCCHGGQSCFYSLCVWINTKYNMNQHECSRINQNEYELWWISYDVYEFIWYNDAPTYVGFLWIMMLDMDKYAPPRQYVGDNVIAYRRTRALDQVWSVKVFCIWRAPPASHVTHVHPVIQYKPTMIVAGTVGTRAA